MRRRAVLAACLAAAAAAAGCGGDDDGGGAPVERGLGVELGMKPSECGLEDHAPDARRLRAANGIGGQVRELLPIVERIRGLELRRHIRPTFLTRAAFEQRLARKAQEEYPPGEAETDRRALQLLGAVPPRFALREAFTEGVAEGVAGIYDPEEDRILVAREAKGRLDRWEQEILGHELVHALQDATFGVDEGREDDYWGDTHLARLALLEGDALAVELRLMAVLAGEPAQRAVLHSMPSWLFFSPPAELPYFLGHAFLFPYREGLGFVCALYRDGGWAAVDRAHRRLPTTSAEILFPERYLARERAVTPKRVGGPGSGWSRAKKTRGAFGAADLLALFEAPSNLTSRALDDPLERAAAWAGGRLDLWVRGRESALAITLVERGDEPVLCESMAEWYGAAFPRGRRSESGGRTLFVERQRTAAVACSGRQVLVAVSESRDAVERLTAGW
jgi:hypothetical protein